MEDIDVRINRKSVRLHVDRDRMLWVLRTDLGLPEPSTDAAKGIAEPVRCFSTGRRQDRALLGSGPSKVRMC